MAMASLPQVGFFIRLQNRQTPSFGRILSLQGTIKNTFSRDFVRLRRIKLFKVE